MSSVQLRILISIISTNINFYDFYNLYGNANFFLHIDTMWFEKHWLEAIVEFFKFA